MKQIVANLRVILANKKINHVYATCSTALLLKSDKMYLLCIFVYINRNSLQTRLQTCIHYTQFIWFITITNNVCFCFIYIFRVRVCVRIHDFFSIFYHKCDAHHSTLITSHAHFISIGNTSAYGVRVTQSTQYKRIGNIQCNACCFIYFFRIYTRMYASEGICHIVFKVKRKHDVFSFIKNIYRYLNIVSKQKMTKCKITERDFEFVFIRI